VIPVPADTAANVDLWTGTLTVEDVAARLRTNRSEVSRLIHRKRDPLPMWRFGKRYLIYVHVFEAWRERNTTGAGSYWEDRERPPHWQQTRRVSSEPSIQESNMVRV
jgi:excisionase family DNA binding protein